jgi:membrane-associated phospholipid phosphatase
MDRAYSQIKAPLVVVLLVLLWALLCIFPVQAHAQSTALDDVARSTFRLESDGHRQAADWASTGLVVGALVVPCLMDRTWDCVKNEALQVGAAELSVELTKLFVHRQRPDLSDMKSFFSGHTTLACVATIRTKAWAFCPAVGYLRVAADKHWATDTLTGAGVAAIFSTVRWGH